MSDGPYFRCLVAVDIRGSGLRQQPTRIDRMHKGMYEVMQAAVYGAGIDWQACWHGDRGDGVILGLPADDLRKLVDPLVGRIRSELRRYNQSVGEFAEIQLRLALHFGLVSMPSDDSDSLLGAPVTHVCRLVDAPAVKEFAARAGDLVLVVSDELYRVITSFGGGLLGAEDFIELAIVHKETRACAWGWASPIGTGHPTGSTHPVWIPPQLPEVDGGPINMPPAAGSPSLDDFDAHTAKMIGRGEPDGAIEPGRDVGTDDGEHWDSARGR